MSIVFIINGKVNLMEIRIDYLLIFVMGLYLTGYSVFTDMFWMKVLCLIMGILDLSFIMSVFSQRFGYS